MSASYALLADDNPNTAQLLACLLALQDETMKVIHVASRSEALDYLNGRGKFPPCPRPDVVFLDMDVPAIGGFEVLSELKADPNLKTIPVVMMAGRRSEAKLKKGYELGANAYVIKPLDYVTFATFARTLGQFWLSMNEAPA